MRIWLSIFLFGAIACVRAASYEITAAFEKANTLYAQGKFTEAAAAYEKILEGRKASSAIYFNLGNAYFKSSQIGRAIVAYRQAEKFSPRDPDVRANLQFARNQVQGPTLRPTRWQNVLGRLTLNEWTGLVATGLWLTFLSLATMQLRPALKSALRSVTAAVAGATLVIAVCLGFAFADSTDESVVVIVGKETTVRISPYDEATSAFAAQDGATLQVLDQKNDWLQVSAANRSGWVKRNGVASLNHQ